MISEKEQASEPIQQCDLEELKREIEQLRQQLAAAQAREKELHQAIEQFWAAQCGDHACACDEHPECVHTLNAYALRDKAIKLDASDTAALEAYVAERVKKAREESFHRLKDFVLLEGHDQRSAIADFVLRAEHAITRDAPFKGPEPCVRLDLTAARKAGLHPEGVCGHIGCDCYEESAPDACTHERLDSDGICRGCGADRRGI